MSTVDLNALNSLSLRLWPTRNKVDQLANSTAEVLKNLPRLSPREALNSETIPAVGKFLKISSRYKKSEAVQKCVREFAAFKLGITSDTLLKNPDFELFAKNNYLYQYLSAFDHKLKEDENGNLQLLHQGEMCSWKDVSEIAQQSKLEIDPDLPKLYNPPLKYSKNGIEHKSYYDWEKLEPFKVEKDPSWKGKYVLEICCLASPRIRLFGDHTWTRLKTPDGSVYSFGVYREDNEVLSGFSVKKGKVQSPDISEFWPEKIHTISFEISKEGFEKVRAKVEEDRKKDQLHFQVINKNCTSYSLEMAELAGIPLQVKESFVSNFIPVKFHKTLKKFLPTFLYRCIHYPFAILFNVLLIVLGGTKVSKSVAALGGKPHFRSIFDFFDSTKVDGQFPSLLAYHLKEEMEKKRTFLKS